MQFDFCPLKAFALVDSRKMNQIDAYDIVNVLRLNFIISELADGLAIIREFDTKRNGYLQYSDFSKLILPLTYPKKKIIAETRHLNSYYKP